MDFPDFHERIGRVAALITADKFTPDIIVGIARGGWIPARLLAGFLGTKKLVSLGISYANSERTDLVAYQDIPSLAAGAHVLIVEDFLESGKSLQVAVKTLADKGTDTRTASIGYLTKSVIIPTYSLGPLPTIPKLPWD